MCLYFSFLILLSFFANFIMWKSLGAQSLLLAGFAVSLITAAASVSTTISNSQIYRFDTDGNAIDMTSDKIDFIGGAYGMSPSSICLTLEYLY